MRRPANRPLTLAVFILAFAARPVPALPPTQDELALARAWTRAHVANGPAGPTAPPFSFTYDGLPSAEAARRWRLTHAGRTIDDTRTEHVTTWADPLTGLNVRCVAVAYSDFPVVEWTLYFRNAGDKDTPLIENINAIDIALGQPGASNAVLRHHTGDLCTPDSYAPHAEPLAPQAAKRIANTGGRPTQTAFPYFNVVWPDRGAIVVLSWAGQWTISFKATQTGEVQVHGGQELTRFRLHPGEEVRSPMGVVLLYSGDWLRGQNLWRQWMVEHNLPRPNGRLVQPMASLCTGNYYHGLMSNAAQELEFLRQHFERGVRFDAWWQDAGWYPCYGDVWSRTGTWEVDATRFPKGLREVSDYVHARGLKSIVWFEPERVTPGTWLADKHPEWVHGGRGGGLLKLGDPDCRQWLTDHIDRILTEQAIDVYRQDFNIDPLPFWRAADPEDRQGITEIRHVEGTFAYWDELLRRHPGMFIDSCASGGRRNDLETLRRAVPLLRSDWYQAPDGQQGHTYGLSLWFPYQGTAGCLYGVMNSRYWIRSQMTAEFTFGPDNKGLATADWDLLKATMDEWRQINRYFFGDFYPLTPYSVTGDVWMAWQYDEPATGQGAVQAFRRGQSPCESARFPLRGLDPRAAFLVTDLDTRETRHLSGDILLKEGLPLTIRDKPGSALILYRRVQPDRSSQFTQVRPRPAFALRPTGHLAGQRGSSICEAGGDSGCPNQFPAWRRMPRPCRTGQRQLHPRMAESHRPLARTSGLRHPSRSPTLDPACTHVVGCRPFDGLFAGSGHRRAEGARIPKAAGFTKVLNMGGGSDGHRGKVCADGGA